MVLQDIRLNQVFIKKIVHRTFEIIRFVCVGLFRTIVGLSIIFTSYNLLHFNYIISNVAGYGVGFIMGFVLHKKWTFRSDRDWSGEVIPYAVIFGIGYLINLVILLFCVEILKINKNASQLIAVTGFTAFNYLGNSFWTFRPPEDR